MKAKSTIQPVRFSASVLVIFFSLMCCLLFFSSIRAQQKSTASPQTATKFRIAAAAQDYAGGRLFITVGGREKKIAEKALKAWIIDGGKAVVFSATDGAGGFEREGQSLRIYEVATGKTRKILSQYYMVDALAEVKLGTGENALLVRMSDGGLGGSYFSVVDPKRGEVFFRRWAELSAINGDRITLAFYRQNDWETINEQRGISDSPKIIPQKTGVKPYKNENHNLRTILKNNVIYNKPDKP
jgi:hypothetical protein